MSNQDTVNFYEAAIELIDKGFVVFPCKEDKTPLTSTGYKAATDEKLTVEDWAKTWPNANVAIACASAVWLLLTSIRRKTFSSFWRRTVMTNQKLCLQRHPVVDAIYISKQMLSIILASCARMSMLNITATFLLLHQRRIPNALAKTAVTIGLILKYPFLMHPLGLNWKMLN